MAYVVDTLIQNTGETDVDFNTRVLQYITDQQYYFQAVGGSFPITAQEGDGAYLGYPPREPSSDENFWDVTAAQMKRIVTFSYDNKYYYTFSGVVPPFPPAPPLPTSGDIAMFGPTGQLTGTGMIADTSLMEIDSNGYRFTDAADAIDPQDLVTLSQLTTYIGGTVNTVNLVAPTLGNIQLTVSNTGTAGTLQWNALNLEIPEADTNTTGLLSSTDWNVFSAKQPAGSYITALTGDGTAAGPGSVALTLATVNAGVGTFGSATKAPVFTVNAKGLITAASETTVTPAASSITSPGAMTRVDDTNVTLSLGGSPTVSLLAATSLTLGWTGQLAVSRGGTGVDTASANRVFAGPTSGGAAAPAFRSLVTGDIPDLSGIYQPLDADLTSWAAVTRASGFDTFVATPSSANLAALVTGETGTGGLVFDTSPTLTNPVVGTQAAGDNSTKAASTAYVYNAIPTQIVASTPANPTGTSSATIVMMGLAIAFTPAIGTRMVVTITGTIRSPTAGATCNVVGRYGTGSAPTNGAADTGSAIGAAQPIIMSTGGANRCGFAISYPITGLSVGTAYWIDLGLSSSGGTAAYQGLSVMIREA